MTQKNSVDQLLFCMIINASGDKIDRKSKSLLYEVDQLRPSGSLLLYVSEDAETEGAQHSPPVQ